MKSLNSFNTKTTLTVGGKKYVYFSLPKLEKKLGKDLSRLPISLRILLENLLRYEDGVAVRKEDIVALTEWNPKADPDKEIAFMPARVILQDFTGVPCIVDLAVMRDAMVRMGGDPKKINPLQPVDLVIDHSVQVDEAGTSNAFVVNSDLEFQRNRERYAFLRWGQQAFKNFRVVPPETGIVHQVNLEYLARIVFSAENEGELCAYPDTLVGTDSHTTMINGLGVLGWGVGGIEAEAAMLGQSVSMLIPNVVGFKLTGTLNPGTTATDLVLTATQMLRKKGVVGKFVEFFGPGTTALSLPNRATVANMAPEYGATMGFFPVDKETLNYAKFTGRSKKSIELIEAYMKAQKLFQTAKTPEPEFSDVLELDLSSVEPSMAGPKRPQDRVTLPDVRKSFRTALIDFLKLKNSSIDQQKANQWIASGEKGEFLRAAQITDGGNSYSLNDGAVVIAAITSCTNTSNPSVVIGAGLLAKKAVERGLVAKPWVKTSLAPGSKVATAYLKKAGLMKPLEKLGFHVVGYGCTTCIGNSGPLPDAISNAIQENNLVAAAVLSGNRNFEGRVHQHVRANYLASPPLVVAYALAGTADIDLSKDPIGTDKKGKPVFLSEIWPSAKEVEKTIRSSITSKQYKEEYASVFEGDKRWKKLPVPAGDLYKWDAASTYIKAAPYFDNMPKNPTPLKEIMSAKVLAMLGDSITTDHISPAGNIAAKGPAGMYLVENGVAQKEFNQFGARRGNHEVMARGTFANVRLRNMIAPGTEGGWSIHPSSKEPISIYDASMKYQQEGIPLIILAGKEYGSGSSRDWAAKGPKLLGVKAVIAESFERIHRSNLVGMGILPCQFKPGENTQSLGLTGFETYDITGIQQDLRPHKEMNVTATGAAGNKKTFTVIARIDTPNEVEYYKNDGILAYVLRSLMHG
jgi:aconitate hydratase